MKRNNQLALWQLDRRLAGLDHRIGQRPPSGWVKTLREALGLTYWELGRRLEMSGVRIWQIERAEVAGSVQLATLERVAGALNCRLLYVFVPDQPLESMDFEDEGSAPRPKNRYRYSTE